MEEKRTQPSITVFPGGKSYLYVVGLCIVKYILPYTYIIYGLCVCVCVSLASQPVFLFFWDGEKPSGDNCQLSVAH